MTVKITKPEIVSLRDELNGLGGNISPDRLPAGSVVQVVSSTISNLSNSSNIGLDSSVPTTNEGAGIASVSIIPKRSGSKFLIHYTFSYDKYNNSAFIACVFRDSTCVNTQYENTGSSPDRMNMSGAVLDTPLSPTGKEITYSLRVGGEAGNTWWVNNNSSTTFFGGTLRHEFIVMEIAQ